MKNYQLIYAETKPQVWSLILVPLFLTAVFIASGESLGFENVPTLTATLIFIAVVAITMLLVINKVVNRPATVTILEDRVVIRLEKTGLLYSRQTEIVMENMARFTEDRNTQNDNTKYFTITLRHPSKSIVLMQPRRMEKKEIREFSKSMNRLIDNYNRQPVATAPGKIRSGSFYDAPWAAVLTWVVYAALLTVTLVAAIGIKVEWYKLLQFYIYGGIWLLAYHTNRSRKVKAKA